MKYLLFLSIRPKPNKTKDIIIKLIIKHTTKDCITLYARLNNRFHFLNCPILSRFALKIQPKLSRNHHFAKHNLSLRY